MIFEGKRILVTGGTGSLGNALVRRILGGTEGIPSGVIVFSRDEAKQDVMRRELGGKVSFRIGDVRDFGRVCSALRDIDVVINAAALKQVPSCEYAPFEAVMTNVMGAENIVHAIEERDLPVEIVVAISTDKACKPCFRSGGRPGRTPTSSISSVSNPGTGNKRSHDRTARGGAMRKRTKQRKLVLTTMNVAVWHSPDLVTRRDVCERVIAALHATDLNVAAAIPPHDDAVQFDGWDFGVTRSRGRAPRAGMRCDTLAKALVLHRYNVGATAKHLRLARSTVRAQIERFGLDEHRVRAARPVSAKTHRQVLRRRR